MAINKNHEFEELNGVKCAIVEKNASQERVDFLKALLELNKYTVVIAATPPPKAPVAPPAATPTEATTPDLSETAPPAPASFTIGVTDVSFNPINAIFGRLLKTKDGHTVTLAYWHQREERPKDDIPYFENEDSFA
jgi:hypothetical protein